MTNFKLSMQGQGTLVLERETAPLRSETVGMIYNRSGRQMAYRVVRTDRVSALGPVYEPTGEGVDVQKLINQHGGADQIAAALGL